MDTDKIEILLRAVELGSLSKAAYEYSYTPSAVSHILDSIENEIGIKFIRRTHIGIETEKGCEDIIYHLKKMLNTRNTLKRIAEDLQTRKVSLTVATYASLSKAIMAKIIKEFNTKNPDIHINIVVVNDIKKTFIKESADIMLGERIEGDNICWEELFVDPYIAVFPKEESLSEKIIKKEELGRYSFVKARHSNISRYIDENHFDNVISVDSHDDSSVIHMVKAGLGVAILPMLSVYGESDINCIQLEPSFERTLGLIYRTGDFETKNELKKFIEYIRTVDFEMFCLNG